MKPNRRIYVYADSRTFGSNAELMGVLTAQGIRNKEVFSFEFDVGWLKRHCGVFLDPEFQAFPGVQYSAKGCLGLFKDSSPDRWGRRLMMRREAIRARQASESPRPLLESDFLLGVYDETRMGALRYKLSPEGEFLNHDRGMAAPPWAYLRELEDASRHLEEEKLTSEHERWLGMLLAPGSSLGGARPKACVLSPSGELWLAKFPSKKDLGNVSAWEYATIQMACDAGIDVPKTRLEQFSPNGSTFLSRRFDRHGTERLYFASAMTLLGKSDGDDADNGASYLELAEFIIRQSPQPEVDLMELWRRILFSIAVSNTDDHLRNHGFLLTEKGWVLSPAYDINPNPQGSGLSLNVSMADNSLDFDLALEVAPFFRVKREQAETTLKIVRRVVANWRQYARHCRIPENEMELMAPAFRMA